MSSEYFFGNGPGWLPERANKIARQYGANLVNHTDDSCNCGYGCRPGTCKKSRRHWFACTNQGEPFNSDKAWAVLDELQRAGILKEGR